MPIGENCVEFWIVRITNEMRVIFGTDNGAGIIYWPDGGMTPFRVEKGTTGNS